MKTALQTLAATCTRRLQQAPAAASSAQTDKALFKAIKTAITEKRLGNAVNLLSQLHDLNSGINSELLSSTTARSEIPHYAASHSLLIRDARGKLTPPGDSTGTDWQDWASIAINYVWAAQQLCDEGVHDKLDEPLLALLTELHKPATERASGPTPEELLRRLVVANVLPLVAEQKKISIRRAQRALLEIKNFMGPLTQEPLTTVTISTGPAGKTIAHVDSPITHMGDALLSTYQAAASDDASEWPSWLTALPSHVQILARQVAKEIIGPPDGQVSIPPELKQLPGLRNAGEELLVDVSDVKATADDGEAEAPAPVDDADAAPQSPPIIYHGYHSAAPGAPKKADTTLLPASIQSLREHCQDAGQPAPTIILTGLYAPVAGEERRLANQVRAALGDGDGELGQDVRFSVLPINWARWLPSFSDPEYAGLKQLMQSAYNALQINDKAISDDQWQDLLRTDTYNPAAYNHPQVATLARRLMRTYMRIRLNPLAYANPSLELAVIGAQLAAALNEADPRLNIVYLMFCKSGKDRTGIARIQTLAEALEAYEPPLAAPPSTTDATDEDAAAVVAAAPIVETPTTDVATERRRVAERLPVTAPTGRAIGTRGLKPQSKTALIPLLGGIINYLFTRIFTRNLTTVWGRDTDQLVFRDTAIYNKKGFLTSTTTKFRRAAMLWLAIFLVAFTVAAPFIHVGILILLGAAAIIATVSVVGARLISKNAFSRMHYAKLEVKVETPAGPGEAADVVEGPEPEAADTEDTADTAGITESL